MDIGGLKFLRCDEPPSPPLNSASNCCTGDDETKTLLETETGRELTLPYNPFAYIQEKRLIAKPENETGKNVNVLDFLKTRPQIAAIEKPGSSQRRSPKKFDGQAAKDAEAVELLNNDLLLQNPASWHRGESIDDFLKRLPVADPATANVGHWLWVRYPHQKHVEGDLESFTEISEELLDNFNKKRAKVEGENPGKPPATITRKMRPDKDLLEEDLLATAVKTRVTCGKWMLFPGPQDLQRYWRIVAQATADGKLGPVSKVGTYDPFDGKDETLICVYTYNFADMDDVRRVLDELVELQVCTRDGKPIYYKCDAYTYLGIVSDNQYKLRASLFSSKEILANKAKVLEEGPIARLKKRNKTIESFLAT